MKFKIKKDLLLEHLNNVGRALSTRNIIPVINGILFDLESDGLYLTATDNEITIKSFIKIDDISNISSNGKVVIYGRFLLDILRKLTAEEIEIEEIDGGKVVISTTSSKYNLNCFNVVDFPNIKIDLDKNPIKLTSGNFKEIINQTVFATSVQESKPLLTGINLKIVGDRLECVATDSYRLAKKNIKYNSNLEQNINIVIPARNINEFVKMLNNDEDEIQMFAFSNKVVFKYSNFIFQSSLINGTYPNTDSLVPNEFETIYKVNLSYFYNILDRASILALSKDKNIVSLETKGNTLTITSSSAEIGKIEEEMNIEVLKGDNIKISFSVKYMLEALKSFNGKEINMYFNGDIKPIIIKDSENEDLLQLILPIKTY